MCREADRRTNWGHRLFRRMPGPGWGDLEPKGGRGVVTGNIRGVPMSAMPSPAQSEFYAGRLSVEPSVKAPAIRPTAVENDPSPITQQSLRKRASRSLARFLITFCIGVAAALAWQSYGDAARQIIASSYPQLGWLAPHAEEVAQNAPDMIAVNGRTIPLPVLWPNVRVGVAIF